MAEAKSRDRRRLTYWSRCWRMQSPLSHHRCTGCPAGAASQNPYCWCSHSSRTTCSQLQITAFSERTRTERESYIHRRKDLLAILPNETCGSLDVNRGVELTGSKRLRVDSWVKTKPIHTVPMTFLRAYRGYGPPTADFKLEPSSIRLIENLTGIQVASASPPARMARGADEMCGHTTPNSYDASTRSRPATTAHAAHLGHSSQTKTSYAARTPTYGTMARSGSPRDLEGGVLCSGDYTMCTCLECFTTRWLHSRNIKRCGSRKADDIRCRDISRFLPSLQTTWRVFWWTVLIVTGAGALGGAGYGTYLLGKVMVGLVLRVSHSISPGLSSCVAAARAVWRFGSRVVGNIGSVLVKAKAGISWVVERVMVLVKALRRLGHWTR